MLLKNSSAWVNIYFLKYIPLNDSGSEGKCAHKLQNKIKKQILWFLFWRLIFIILSVVMVVRWLFLVAILLNSISSLLTFFNLFFVHWHVFWFIHEKICEGVVWAKTMLTDWILAMGITRRQINIKVIGHVMLWRLRGFVIFVFEKFWEWSVCVHWFRLSIIKEKIIINSFKVTQFKPHQALNNTQQNWYHIFEI